jgi:DNA topoisomerase-1
MEGRFGAYVSDGEIHATLPKSADPKTVTLEEGVRLIDEKAAKGPSTKKKKKAAPKKAAATKKPTAKKPAVKKPAAKKKA